eukprot:GEMP01001766.1.p1 GENE.GEMP01001766.1~~GEMP01001766.1.p1  ORF type:complete len:990 (+),score=211.45 GEMP01001766.1:110-3079(+)
MRTGDDTTPHWGRFLPPAVHRASESIRSSLTRAIPGVTILTPVAPADFTQQDGWNASKGSDAPAVPALRRLDSSVQGDINKLKPELEPLRQYLTEEDSYSERWVDRIFGLSNNDENNLNRLGIKNTTDQQLRGIMWRLVHSRHCTGDIASMLRDSRVKWCLFNMFQTDIDLDDKETKVFVIRAFSKFSQFVDVLMWLIAMWSISYSIFIYCYWDVIAKYFENDGAPRIEDPTSVIAWLRISDNVLHVLYFAGTIVRLRTSQVDTVMATETVDPQRIWKATLSDWTFWCDTMTCFPWLEMASKSRGSIARIAQVGVLLRGWRLKKKSLKRWFLAKDGIFSILWLLIYVIFVGHLAGCFFFLFHSVSLNRHPGLHGQGAENHCASESSSASLSLLYLYTLKTGVYLMLAIDIGGYSSWENLFIALISPVGALFNACVVSQIIIMVTRRSALDSEHTERTDNVRQAMATLALPSTLQLRVMSYYTYEKIHRSHATYNALFQGLNSQLNFELHLVLYYELLTNTPFFKEAQPKLLRELVLALNDVLFLPGDYVCRFGDEGKEMYFIYKGDCSVIHENMSTVLKTLHPGDYFGEISLLTNQKRTAFVRADFFCTLASLNKDHFDNIMRLYPKQLEVIVSLMSDIQRALIEKYNKEQVHSRRPSFCPPLVRSRANSRIFPDVEQPTGEIKNENIAVAEAKSSSKSSSSEPSSSAESEDRSLSAHNSHRSRPDSSSKAHNSEQERKHWGSKMVLPLATAVPPGTSVNPSKQPSPPGDTTVAHENNAATSADSGALDKIALGSKLSKLAVERGTKDSDDEEGADRVTISLDTAMLFRQQTLTDNRQQTLTDKAALKPVNSQPTPKITLKTVVVAPPSPKRDMGAMLAELAILESEIDSRIKDLMEEQESIVNCVEDVQDWWNAKQEEEQNSSAQCQAALEAITAQAEFTRDEVVRLLTMAEEEDDLGAKAAGIVEATLNRRAEISVTADDTSNALLL